MKAIDLLEISPVIAAVKDDDGLRKCLDTECQVVFILYGNICNIRNIVETVKLRGKYAMVHADLVQGLGSKEVAIDFIKEQTGADGIISTKPMLVRRAQELKMFGILRAFIIDSMAVDNTKKMLETFRPDMIEVMPGVIPKIIQHLRANTGIPLIAGGLISEKKEVLELFSAGADAISTTRQDLWYI